MFFFKKKKPPIVPQGARIWGKNSDGSVYVSGITVADLRSKLEKFLDTDEICVAVCRKKDWNGGGLLGKLQVVENGSIGQIWLKALVVDPTLE